MEEKLSKQGLLVPFLFFIVSLTAHATTFGPISLVAQLKESASVFHGKIHGRKVEMEPYVKRPYTYWGLSVLEQLQGQRASSEITIRSPGGEIGNIGYRIPGSADFSEGEEVVIMVHDTREGDNVKEVVGLASGKYTVKENARGEKILENGLGAYLKKENGDYLTLNDLIQLIDRTQKNQNTEEDTHILVNPSNGAHSDHLDDPKHSQLMQDVASMRSVATNSNNQTNDSNNSNKSTNNAEMSADKPSKWQSKDFLWLPILIVGIGGVLLGILFLRRKK